MDTGVETCGQPQRQRHVQADSQPIDAGLLSWWRLTQLVEPSRLVVGLLGWWRRADLVRACGVCVCGITTLDGSASAS
eukprot:366418-Chlamydomonas_euryale.AAC.3